MDSLFRRIQGIKPARSFFFAGAEKRDPLRFRKQIPQGSAYRICIL